MRISIVLCTYNGANFICEQLESIMMQKYLPDEVLIFDDCSTDNTAEIIENFININNLNWRLSINNQNKGWIKNFFEGLQKSTGEYVFFCDQDDIWYPEKINNMLEIMKGNNQILALNGGMDLINNKGQYIYKKPNKIRVTSSGKRKQVKFYKSKGLYNIPGISGRHVSGCTLAIRRNLADVLARFEVDSKYGGHDVAAVNIAAVLSGHYYINNSVIKYRIHGNNVTLIEQRSISLAEKIENIVTLIDYYNRLINCILTINTNKDNREFKTLLRVRRLYRLRKKVLEKSNFFFAFSLFPFLDLYIGKKHLGFRTFLADIADTLNLREKIRKRK